MRRSYVELWETGKLVRRWETDPNEELPGGYRIGDRVFTFARHKWNGQSKMDRTSVYTEITVTVLGSP